MIAPDDTVTIRIAQTELGQGVWTSNAMIVCEELQCDWSKVRPQYASANRDAREMAPDWTLNVPGNGGTDPKGGGEPGSAIAHAPAWLGIPDSLYRRMRTNAAASVKDGRYYLQLAGAEARERLLLAAAALWKRAGRRARREGRRDHARRRAAARRHTARSRSSPPRRRIRTRARSRSSRPISGRCMGTEQQNLDVPMKVTGETVYSIDVRVPGHEVGGREVVPRLRRRREELRLRRGAQHARRALGRAASRFPIRSSRAAACSAAALR